MGITMRNSPRNLETSLWRKLTLAAASTVVVCAVATAPVYAQNKAAGSSGDAKTAALPAGPQSTMPSSYVLGSGDHVRVTVFGQAELTGEYIVDGQGDISFPLIGRLHVGGMNGEQVQHLVERKLSPDYLKDPHVAVEVLTYRPFYIVGEVKTPGSYPYVSGMTVLNAIALAGGYTYRAREDSFYLTRTEKNGSKEKLDADSTSPVLPGDIITVRERYF